MCKLASLTCSILDIRYEIRDGMPKFSVYLPNIKINGNLYVMRTYRYLETLNFKVENKSHGGLLSLIQDNQFQYCLISEV